jgi:hypothetical protein
VAVVAAALAVAPAGVTPTAAPAAPRAVHRGNCALNSSLCTEVADSEQVFGKDVYVGHDEPAVIFYGNTPGAGNDNTYLLRLPKDPPRPPGADGSGGTFDFQLRATFWLGMAMCDNQSAPAPGANAGCAPDSDANIFDDPNPASPHYIGKHPGTAFMEMQFYPPGWVPWPAGLSCDPTRWCAALNIDSLSENLNTGAVNNTDCQNTVGVEPVNFAFLTKNGRASTPADPANNDHFTVDPANDLFMDSGDSLAVHLFDTPAGFRVDVHDVSSGQRGSMTASTGNGFAQVLFQPDATTCTTAPAAFHPTYSTSSEHTRVPWAAHTYNTAFSDEIGHFENCAAADPNTGRCVRKAAGEEPIDADDNACFNPSDSTRIQIGGCLAEAPTDNDFDGVSYQRTWPGTGAAAVDRATKPQSELFTSPLIHGVRSFDRVAFEADLPRIEDNADSAAPCNRTTGANCVDPPPGANFYPLYSTTNVAGACAWQQGGAAIPGTVNSFGGSSATEFGQLLQTVYPTVGNVPITRINNFRQVLPDNPCRLIGSSATALAPAG